MQFLVKKGTDQQEPGWMGNGLPKTTWYMSEQNEFPALPSALSAHIASFSGLQYMSLKLITFSTSGRMTLPSSLLLSSMQKAFKFRKLICSAQSIPKPERAIQSQGEKGNGQGGNVSHDILGAFCRSSSKNV